MNMNYVKYRIACEKHGVPPLTKREWETEGCPTFKQSNRISNKFQEKKHDEWVQRTGWI